MIPFLPKFKHFRQLIVLLLSISLATAYSSIHAQEIKTPTEKTSESNTNSNNGGQLSDQGKLRTYYLYTPKSYSPNRPMPLVLVFHGDGGSGRSIADVSRFNDLADQKGFMVAYPDAIDHKWSVRGNSVGKVNDVLFVGALIDHIQKEKNVDSSRIYAAGFSKGGILTQALGCQLSDRIAAFASVAGAFPERIKSSCQQDIPVSMLMINGTNDKEVRYQGDDKNKRGALMSVPETVSFWRTLDQCPSSARLSEPSQSDGISVKTSRYDHCNGNSEVMLAAVGGGGHMWPGGVSSDKNLNKFNDKLGFNATQSIWNFFGRHNLSEEES